MPYYIGDLERDPNLESYSCAMKPCAKDMCLVVTHGLTIRLMLMCLFNWSVATFESVWSLDQGFKFVQ